MTFTLIVRTIRSGLARKYSSQLRRSFITLPSTEAATLSEIRVLPYKYTNIYAVIADVDSYSKFLPYCQESRVTQWSAPDSSGRKWPAKADLKIGWGGYEETFTSKIYCVPYSFVEALGGDARTTLSKDTLSHYSSTFHAPSTVNNIFKSLSTKWTIRPYHYKPPSGSPQHDNTTHPVPYQTEIGLTIEFRFSNPVYAALSQAVAPKVARVIIEAFEERARSLVDG